MLRPFQATYFKGRWAKNLFGTVFRKYHLTDRAGSPIHITSRKTQAWQGRNSGNGITTIIYMCI